MKALPKKFEMCTKYAPYDKRIMEQSVCGDYMMSIANPSLENTWDKPMHYSERFVSKCIEEGSWIVTKDMDEPELAFPFTAEVAFSGNVYEVVKGSTEGYVSKTYLPDNTLYENFSTVEQAKQFIKDGTWIVKHVGEKIQEPALVSNGSIATSKITVNDLSSIGSIGVLSTRALPEAPQSRSTSNLAVDSMCDTCTTEGAIERTRQALEDLAITYESLIALQRKFKGGV